MKYAAAYLRRSSVSAASPGDASREAQSDAAKALAALYAPEAELREFVDWGISGRRDDRPEYVKLKTAIRAGEVCCVFAFSLSRLGRSNGELDAFFKLCAEHDVTVYTKSEGVLGKTSAMGGFLLTIMSAMAELESETAKERSAAARKAKADRGDHIGLPPYGYMHVRDDAGRLILAQNPDQPVAPIIEAYREAGTILGTCRILEAKAIPAPRGGRRWATSLVTRILENHAPELLPRRAPSGTRSPSSAMFAQLLRCPFCGRMLTPNTHRRQYYCANGPRDRAAHPRYTVREIDLMPWLIEEAARLDIPADQAALEGIEAKQDAINARLEAALELYLSRSHLMPKPKFEAEQKRAEAELAALAGSASVAAIHPVVDWNVAPETINAALRSMWSEVRLDDQLRPVEAEWIVPEWRA